MSSARLRIAGPDDHGLYAHFFAQLGTPDPPLDRERWQRESAAASGFLELDGQALGYAHWEAAGELAHVRHVAVDESKRRQGLGTRLMHALAEFLRERGVSHWRLNVFADNLAAIRLYESLGLRTKFTTEVLRLDWEHIPRLQCADSSASEIKPRDDAELEQRFGLLDGQLARARQRAGVRLFAARSSDGVVVGLASFDANFPGAYPFRCAKPVHARTLLSAMHESYDADRAQVQIVIEDDALTAAHIASAGAERLRDIVHMRGDLPR
jgi:GNAT superfamily N-acetyltransferase